MATRPFAMPPRRKTDAPCGMALVMVVSAVAVAAVLGYALLAATQLQAQAGGNVVRSASADYLADSGVQLVGLLDVSCRRGAVGRATLYSSIANEKQAMNNAKRVCP